MCVPCSSGATLKQLAKIALDVGESDVGKLCARQKQLDIGKNTVGYEKLIERNLHGRQLQEIIKLPYIL